jgi:hypothetical protein
VQVVAPCPPSCESTDETLSRSGVALSFLPHAMSMSEFKPTLHEHLAIEAKLNMLLGAAIYDRLLTGFRGVSVREGVLLFLVASENLAVIDSKYSMHLAIVVKSVLRRAVKSGVLNPKTKSKASQRRAT